MISVAIDGPAGAGKSTISRRIAKKLGYIYVDTGALYRTVALWLVKNNIAADDKENVVKQLDKITVDLVYIDNEQKVMLNGDDVTALIRTAEVSMAASVSSAIPEVRAFLLDLQRKMAEKYNIVMDGRDIATVVLPNATVKIFLTADVEERAKRRYDEMILKDPTVKYEDVLKDVIKRDENDSTRAVAPLKPAEDSIIINTTGISFEDSVELLYKTVMTKIGG